MGSVDITLGSIRPSDAVVVRYLIHQRNLPLGLLLGHATGQYEPIWQRMPGRAAESCRAHRTLGQSVVFYDECCGTPRRPPPRKSQATVGVLEAALAHFIAGKDVSPWLLPKGPIPRPTHRYQFRKTKTGI
jgi:hypothetical protein